MRIGIGALAATYPFPMTPFMLINGRQISDPASETPQGDDCLPYQCGADPASDLPRMWCSFWGHSGTRSCAVDVSCQPYLARIPFCHDLVAEIAAVSAPQTVSPTESVPPAVSLSPAVTRPADLALPAAAMLPLPSTIPTLTPQNIVQPLPDISEMLAPRPVPLPDASLWCVLNGAIEEHPLIAGLILAGGIWLLWRKGKQ